MKTITVTSIVDPTTGRKNPSISTYLIPLSRIMSISSAESICEIELENKDVILADQSFVEISIMIKNASSIIPTELEPMINTLLNYFEDLKSPQGGFPFNVPNTEA